MKAHREALMSTLATTWSWAAPYRFKREWQRSVLKKVDEQSNNFNCYIISLVGCVRIKKAQRRDRERQTTSPKSTERAQKLSLSAINNKIQQMSDRISPWKWLSSFRKIFSTSSATSLPISSNLVPSFRAALRVHNSQAPLFEACTGKHNSSTHFRLIANSHAVRSMLSPPRTREMTRRLHLPTKYSSHIDGLSCGGLWFCPP